VQHAPLHRHFLRAQPAEHGPSDQFQFEQEDHLAWRLFSVSSGYARDGRSDQVAARSVRVAPSGPGWQPRSPRRGRAGRPRAIDPAPAALAPMASGHLDRASRQHCVHPNSADTPAQSSGRLSAPRAFS